MGLFSSTQPSLRARVLPRFPASVVAGTGMTITKSGGTYTFSAAIATRTKLTEDTSFYVSTTGSNVSGDGTSTSPWATIQFAADYIFANIDCGQFRPTIQLSPGTYTPGALAVCWLQGNNPLGTPFALYIEGIRADPTQTIIDAQGLGGVRVDGGRTVYLRGLKYIDSVGGGTAIIANSPGAHVYVGESDFGDMLGGTHMFAAGLGSILGSVEEYTISGGAAHHMFAEDNAFIDFENIILNITGNPPFSSSFIRVFQGGTVYFYGMTIVGTATGPRFDVSYGGKINTSTSGGMNSGIGLSGLPGDSPGIGWADGLYDDWIFSTNAVDIPNTQTGANYTVLASDGTIIANAVGTMTVALPLASNYRGRVLTFLTHAAQTVISNASNVVPLIGGAAGTAILAATAGKWADLQSDGTNWVIVRSN